MKINKLLGTVALCSSLLLAVACSTKRGFESNSAPATTLTVQELLQQEKLEKLEETQAIISTQLQNLNKSMSASERKLFNEIVKEKAGEEGSEIISQILDGDLDDTSDLSENDRIALEKYKAEVAAIALQAMQTAKKKVLEGANHPASEFTNSNIKKLNIKIKSDGNKLELLGSEQGDSLVYTNTSINDGEEIVLSFSKNVADISDEQASDLYVNDNLVSHRKAQMSCIDINCDTVIIVFVSSDDVTKPIVFTKVDGVYKQLAKVNLTETPSLTMDQAVDALGRDKSVHSYDEVKEQTKRYNTHDNVLGTVESQNTPNFSDELIEERMIESGHRAAVEQGFMSEEDARNDAINSLLND